MKELLTALMKAQNEMSHAAASAVNPHFNSKFVPFEMLVDYVKPVLHKHGIIFQQISHFTDQGACIETILYGHGAQINTGPVMVRADKPTSQAHGSAITYAKRYSLSIATGVGADKDDDAEKAMESSRQPKATTRTQEAPPSQLSGAYRLSKGNVTLVTQDSAEALLAACRQHLSDPTTDNCQQIYKSSKDSIRKAHNASSGDTKTRLGTLMSLYGDGDGIS